MNGDTLSPNDQRRIDAIDSVIYAALEACGRDGMMRADAAILALTTAAWIIAAEAVDRDSAKAKELLTVAIPHAAEYAKLIVVTE
jgi:hypothetical protein